MKNIEIFGLGGLKGELISLIKTAVAFSDMGYLDEAKCSNLHA